MTQIILKNLAWVPYQAIPEELFEDYYYTVTKPQFDETTHKWEEVEKEIDLLVDSADRKYVGFPRGDLQKLTKHLPADTRIKDLRSVRPLSFNLQLGPHVQTDSRWQDQEKLLNAWIAKGGGVIQAPAASGKSVIGVAATCDLGLNTLCLFDQRDFLFQWHKEFYKHSNLEELEDRYQTQLLGQYTGDEVFPITLSTFQRVNSKNSSLRKHANYFGLVIVDEAHCTPAPSYRRAIRQFNPFLYLGVTATPIRRDGLHPIIFDTLGPIAVRGGVEQLNPLILVQRTPWTVTEHRARPDFAQWGHFINQLVRNTKRNKMLVDNLVTDVNGGRCIVAISDRVNHLYVIKDMLAKHMDPGRIVVVHGKIGGRERIYKDVENGEYDVMLAIGKILNKGVNIERLDTLHHLTPISGRGTQCEQRVGRIRRKKAGKKRPLVRDYVDKGNTRLTGSAKSRLNVYGTIEAEVRDAETNCVLDIGDSKRIWTWLSSSGML